MKGKFCFIGFLFSMIYPAIYCQQPDYIIGKVIDSKTSKAVSYATLRLINSQVGLITNAEGDFRIIKSPGFQSDSLIVTCIGYRRLSVPFARLNVSRLNYLKLEPYIYGLNEVTVTAKKRRLRPEIIIARALRDIRKNSPDTPFSYVSYYRDYVKDSINYLNLNEAIIETLDKGFSYPSDSNRYRLLEFRKNMDFKRISISPYYNVEGSDHTDISFKRMPMASVGDQYGNELFVLLAHDAIRNFDSNTFFYIDTLSRRLLKNHVFNSPEGIWDGNTLLYRINFEAKRKVTQGKYQASGAIFIQPDDYSIHRLEYSATGIDKGKKKHKIFNIEIEYGHEPLLNDKMCLRYISFNNTFIMQDPADSNYFKITSGRWASGGLYKDFFSDLTAAIVFNHDIDSIFAQDKNHYDITIRGEKARIRKIKTVGKTLYLTIQNKNYNIVQDSCRINVSDLKDTNGNITGRHRDIVLRQFRELFVQAYAKPFETQDSCFIKSRPLGQNCILLSPDTGRYWMNTPLKAEEMEQDLQNH